jgi:hypothetical protein
MRGSHKTLTLRLLRIRADFCSDLLALAALGMRKGGRIGPGMCREGREKLVVRGLAARFFHENSPPTRPS